MHFGKPQDQHIKPAPPPVTHLLANIAFLAKEDPKLRLFALAQPVERSARTQFGSDPGQLRRTPLYRQQHTDRIKRHLAHAFQFLGQPASIARQNSIDERHKTILLAAGPDRIKVRRLGPFG